MKIQTKLLINSLLFTLMAFGISLVTIISFSQTSHGVTDSLVIILILCIGLISTFSGYLVSRSITKSIKTLEEAVSEISAGNFSFRAKVTSKDEVGRLAQVFNAMATKLQDFYSNLEYKVSEQTRQLQLEKRKIAEDKVRSEAILSDIGDGIIVVSDGGEITMVNKQAERMLNCKKEELHGQRVIHFIKLYDQNGNEISPEKRPIRLALIKGIRITGRNLFYARKNGSKFPVSLTASPVFFNGKLIGGVNIFRDMTKEWEIDQMKNEFISLASHQLRTPLSAMKWTSELLIGGDLGELSQEQLDMLNNIYQSNEHMIELVNLLLNISRIESGRISIEPQPTDLKLLINDVVRELQPQITAKKQNLLISINDKLDKVNIDPRLVRHIYLNLISNAVKYTPDNGQITVIVSRRNDFIINQVSDNGYGIQADQQSKIFQKFFRASNTTKKVAEGTGLGLYLAKVITESSGGEIWFKSSEGEGTAFWFSLPVNNITFKKGEVTLD